MGVLKFRLLFFWDTLLTTFYLLAQGMSYDGGDVFTMMIKQDSRDSNVYDAPAYIPDIQVQHFQLISHAKLPRTLAYCPTRQSLLMFIESLH